MFLVLLVVAVTALVAVYRYYKWHSTYWERLGVKSPPSTLFFGHWKNLDDNMNPPSLQIAKWTKEYGSVYGIYEGIRKVLVISDPDMLQELFLKKFEYFYGRKQFPVAPNPATDPRVHVFSAEGSRWKRLRTLSAPSFSINSLKKIHLTVEDSAINMLDFMRKHADDGKGFNIHRYYQEYTMDVIARIAMGQEGCKQFENPAVDWVQKHFLAPINNPIVYAISGLPFFPQALVDLFRATAGLRGRTFPLLFTMIEKTVDERKEQRRLKLERGEELGDPIDFIDLFLDAEAPDMQISTDGIDRANVKVEKNLTTQEIVAQCFVFLLAGFDTTANSLAYASFLLSKHPEKMKRLQEELDEHCHGEAMDYDSLHKLKYMDCVVKESLRMYPLGAFANSRTCMKETTLGDIPIEKGVLIMADPFSVHYSKEIWGEDADQFRPERWEEGATRHQLSWLPFGAGPRQCIGMRLAYMEEKLALGHILKNYDIVAGPETEKDLKLVGAFTISPDEVTVYLKSRQY